MTTIRRIPTSKIDGNGSNSTNTDEIRPYGEIAVYVGNDNKLELLMFDGVRTHLKSKVLNKGTFYGGDADSADGYGLDTIKLVPDAELYNNGNHQYLIVDPTAPNHIHLRPGGTIDQSNADLFLGGELNHVRVSDGYNNVSISTDTENGGTQSWIFNNDGALTLPNNALIKQNTSEVAVQQQTYNITVSYWDNLKQFDLIPTAEAQGITVEGWPFLTWDLSGGYPQQYLTQLDEAWAVQQIPSSPPSPLIFNPPISAPMKDQMRVTLIAAINAWDALQSSISTIDIVTGNTTTTIGNGKLTAPEIIQTTPEEDLVIRTRYEVPSSPPGSGPTYSERNFTFGTNGTLTFPNGTVQYGAAIDLAYLKSIVANSTSFDDFKNAIANL